MYELQIHMRDYISLNFRTPNVPISAFNRFNQKLITYLVKLLKANRTISLLFFGKVPNAFEQVHPNLPM